MHLHLDFLLRVCNIQCLARNELVFCARLTFQVSCLAAMVFSLKPLELLLPRTASAKLRLGFRIAAQFPPTASLFASSILFQGGQVTPQVLFSTLSLADGDVQRLRRHLGSLMARGDA